MSDTEASSPAGAGSEVTLPLSAAPIPDPVPPEAPPTPPAGGFVLLRPYDAGGLGLVGVARDVALDREVAFKQIRPELADDPGSRRRFVHEAKITGQLEHPGIVPIHAFGCDADGRPYYAMKFVRGLTLRQAIAEYHIAPAPRAFRDLLRRFVSVCQAIAYAHSKGVVHRDLKPANIMLGDYGETLILDWGLAKHLVAKHPDTANPATGTQAAELENFDALFAGGVTGAGQVVGTPGYMPPEQAGGTGEIGPPADVYSLGAVLYKLLCNRTPYRGSVAPDALLRGKLDAPEPPSRGCAGVPKALEAVCLRAMATRPEDRYDAADLAREVERWLADEPVTAWREPAAVRALRWARHHKAVVAGLAVLLVSLTVALAVNNVLVSREQARTETARLRAEEASARATAQEAQARRQQRIAQDNEREARLQVARSLVYQGEALALAGQWEPARMRYADGGDRLAALGESRFPADVGLWNTFRAAPPPLLRCQVGAAITALAFAPDSGTVLLATQPGAIEIRDVHSGRLVGPAFNLTPRTLPAGPSPAGGPQLPGVNCVAFSADGRLAVSGSDDGALTVWDANSGSPRGTLHADTGPVTAVAFSGQQVLFGSADKTLRLWDPDNINPVRALPGLAGGINALACSADGRVALSGGSEISHNVRAWDVQSGQVTHVFAGHTDNVAAVALSADGRVAVSGSVDGTVCLWDMVKEQLVQTFGGTGQTFSAVALYPDKNPDKCRVLSGTRAGRLQLWSGGRASPAATFAGHQAAINSAAFSADGRLAASGDADGVLLLWDTVAGQEAGGARTFAGPNAFATCVAFSPDGLTALSGHDQIVQLWDVATGLPLETFTGQGQPVTCVAFAPDGRSAASGGVPDRRSADSAAKDGSILLWDLVQKGPGRRLDGGRGAAHAVAFSPDSRFLAAGGADGTVRLWDVRPATPVSLGEIGRLARPVTCLAFSPDGSLVLSGGADGALNAAAAKPLPATVHSGQPGRSLGKQGSGITCLAISPDGRTALSGAHRDTLGPGGALVLWDLNADKPPHIMDAQTGFICGVGFTPDGRFALSCTLDQKVMLWDVNRNGEPFRGTLEPGESFERVAFSPDGRRLISGGYGHALRLWDYDAPARCNNLMPRAEAAINTLEAVPTNSPGPPEALVALGEWYAFRGRPDWAGDFFARAAVAGADPPALTWGRCAWLSGDTATALREMRVARSRSEAPAPYLSKCLDAIESSANQTP